MTIRKLVNKELLKRAVRGDAEAHYEIALLMRQYGKIGFMLGAFKEAAKLGHPTAQAMLNLELQRFKKRKSSEDISAELLLRAKNEDPVAYYELALITLRQNEVGFALGFFKLAAQQGYALAQEYLSILSDTSKNIAEQREIILNATVTTN